MKRLSLFATALLLPVVLHAQAPATPPAAGPLRPFNLPAQQQVTLDNGLRMIVVESHDLPVFSLSLSLVAGSKRDLAGREGTATLLAELLTHGTATRSADQIATQV